MWQSPKISIKICQEKYEIKSRPCRHNLSNEQKDKKNITRKLIF